jgi:hypothetical protein
VYHSLTPKPTIHCSLSPVCVYIWLTLSMYCVVFCFSFTIYKLRSTAEQMPALVISVCTSVCEQWMLAVRLPFIKLCSTSDHPSQLIHGWVDAESFGQQIIYVWWRNEKSVFLIIIDWYAMFSVTIWGKNLFHLCINKLKNFFPRFMLIINHYNSISNKIFLNLGYKLDDI